MKKITAASISSAVILSLMLAAPVSAQEAVNVTPPEQIQNESSVLVIGDQPAEGQTVTQQDGIAMYRLYNPNSGEHFYTADETENRDLSKIGWKCEGIGWYAPGEGAPVYRLYNANAGDHHYTTDQTERDTLINAGWQYEKVGWYSAGVDGQPVYRQYNRNAKTGTHNYTIDPEENEGLIKAGWHSEGVGWYGLRLSCPPVSLMQQLEQKVRAYQELLGRDRSVETGLDGLREQGNEIGNILNAFPNQFENRYYVFKNGHLIGASSIGSNAVPLPSLQDGGVMILQTAERKIQMADHIANNRLQGNALYIRSTGGTTKVQAAAGNLVDGLFEGNTAGYLYIEDPNNEYEEYSFGPAAGNLLNGTIHKHTHYFKSNVTRLKEFDWNIQVENGKAKYEKIGNYYYVCRTDSVNVYYDYIPVNLSFWPVAS